MSIGKGTRSMGLVHMKQIFGVLIAARESCEVMEKEVARLEQLNKDLKATCQQLQATVDDLSWYNQS